MPRDRPAGAGTAERERRPVRAAAALHGETGAGAAVGPRAARASGRCPRLAAPFPGEVRGPWCLIQGRLEPKGTGRFLSQEPEVDRPLLVLEKGGYALKF